MHDRVESVIATRLALLFHLLLEASIELLLAEMRALLVRSRHQLLETLNQLLTALMPFLNRAQICIDSLYVLARG